MPAADNDSTITGRGWRFYLVAALIVLALVFVIQNSQDATIKFLFSQTELPLFFALVIAIALGVVIGYLLPRLRGTRMVTRLRDDAGGK